MDATAEEAQADDDNEDDVDAIVESEGEDGQGEEALDTPATVSTLGEAEQGGEGAATQPHIAEEG